MLENLAAQKFLPTIAEKQARWQAILDSPKDAARLTQLAEAMPPVCRSENPEISPKQLFTSYFNTFGDSLIRTWGIVLISAV